jgi:pSer/pThr/pTyr-binding forkhead associated (FHA) protein
MGGSGMGGPPPGMPGHGGHGMGGGPGMGGPGLGGGPGPMGVGPMGGPMGGGGGGMGGGGAMPSMGPPGGGVVAGSIGGAGSAPLALPAACPRCGSPTQPGFAFCQQCGMKLTPQPPQGIDALAGTIASTGPQSGAARAAAMAPTPAAGAWGSAVSVNRDGSDGERYPLGGEFVTIGRHGADVVFEQDRFLGRQHARLEPTPDGAARVVPIDTLNGVFRKIDAPVELVDGAIVLAGREVLRFEAVDADERNATPLIRHGVALFGSPPREPWGRLLQLLPSGGIRDVRHLWDDEIVIGREDGDLVFSDDQFLSRRHASIAWDGARATLNDLGSSNGTFIRLVGPTAIKNGDHLRMGDQLFRIELGRR